MADVAFLPVQYAEYNPLAMTLTINYFDITIHQFSKYSLSQNSRSVFEQSQRADRFAHEALEGYLRRAKGSELITIADARHPLRLGGSALNTILDLSDDTLYAVMTGRGTNRNPAKPVPSTLAGIGNLKNAGGLPNSVETHLSPGLIGQKEGLGEVLFARDGLLLCPEDAPIIAFEAIDSAMRRINSYFKTDIKPWFDPGYRFLPCTTGHTLQVRSAMRNYRYPDCAFTWNAKVATLEVSEGMYLLEIPNLDSIDTIMAGDGEGMEPFLEDIYVAKIDDLAAALEVGAISVPGWKMRSEPRNWENRGKQQELPFNYSDTLPELLDAAAGRYSFDAMLRRIDSSKAKWAAPDQRFKRLDTYWDLSDGVIIQHPETVPASSRADDD